MHSRMVSCFDLFSFAARPSMVPSSLTGIRSGIVSNSFLVLIQEMLALNGRNFHFYFDRGRNFHYEMEEISILSADGRPPWLTLITQLTPPFLELMSRPEDLSPAGMRC